MNMDVFILAAESARFRGNDCWCVRNGGEQDQLFDQKETPRKEERQLVRWKNITERKKEGAVFTTRGGSRSDGGR